MKVIFCNVGWMERYIGLNKGDSIAGGGSYVKKRGRGNEICNYAPYRNNLYGYVQPPGSQIDIERIGAKPGEESISGVTVIWTATRPTGGTAVIGWYKNATVYRDYQRFSKAPATQKKNGVDCYLITAPSKDATLLPVDKRTLEIPRQVKGSMGRANVWYADKPESKPILNEVLSLVRSGKVKSAIGKKNNGKQDQDRKARIEKAAIKYCAKHFESIGYNIESVEKDNVGWDLEAISGSTKLNIEVKGLSGKEFSVELTPNEYRAFSELSATYRLVVVTNALDTPFLYVCRYSEEYSDWVIDDKSGRSLEIEIKKSASIKCV